MAYVKPPAGCMRITVLNPLSSPPVTFDVEVGVDGDTISYPPGTVHTAEKEPGVGWKYPNGTGTTWWFDSGPPQTWAEVGGANRSGTWGPCP